MRRHRAASRTHPPAPPHASPRGVTTTMLPSASILTSASCQWPSCAALRSRLSSLAGVQGRVILAIVSIFFSPSIGLFTAHILPLVLDNSHSKSAYIFINLSTRTDAPETPCVRGFRMAATMPSNACRATRAVCARLYAIPADAPRFTATEKPTGEQCSPSAKRKPYRGAAAVSVYFMPSHLLFSMGFKAPNAFGSPQYLAPVAHTMR